MLNIVEISKRRYTTKHYDNSRVVSKKELDELLEVLRNAPSSVNSQPWHFIVIDNKTSQNKILPAIAEFNHSRIKDSSYTIIFCIKAALSDDYLKHLLQKESEDGRFPNEEIKDAQDKGRRYFVGLNSQVNTKLYEWEKAQVYIALGQFLFAAAAINVDSTPIEGFDAEKLDTILNLKEQGLKSTVIATIGFASKDDSNAKRPKSRLSQDELFTFI